MVDEQPSRHPSRHYLSGRLQEKNNSRASSPNQYKLRDFLPSHHDDDTKVFKGKISHLKADHGSVNHCSQLFLAPPEQCRHHHPRELVLALVRLDELHDIGDRAVHVVDQGNLSVRGRVANLTKKRCFGK